MIKAGDIRKGTTIEIEGNVFTVIDFLHVKPGKGSAFVRTKMKNAMTRQVLERTCNPTDTLTRASIETTEKTYLYNDGDFYYFMALESYEQIPMNHDVVEDAIPYVLENTNCTVRFFKGSAFSVEAPNFVTLTVTETEPGVKGDTATNVTKKATVETGAVVAVPLFINEGEKIRIDTRTGEYMERA